MPFIKICLIRHTFELEHDSRYEQKVSTKEQKKKKKKKCRIKANLQLNL